MRKRLTSKCLGVTAQRYSEPFSGDIGNDYPAEKDKGADCTYDWQPGWDLPEDYNWDDPRDEMNLGIPKKASRFMKAKKAVVLAQMLLGDNASDKMLQKQASAFLSMPYDGIVASIKRWKATEEVAPADEETDFAADDEAIEEEVAVDAPADATDDVSELEAPAEQEEADEPEMVLDINPVAEDPTTEMFNNAGELGQAQADEQLQAMFAGCDEAVADDETAPAAPAAPVAKKGIKHLAAAPKLASKQQDVVKKLEGIWTGIKSFNL